MRRVRPAPILDGWPRPPTSRSHRSVRCGVPRWVARRPNRCGKTSGCSAQSSATRSASRTARRCSTSSSGRASSRFGCDAPRSTAPSWPRMFDGIDIHQAHPRHPGVHPLRAAGQRRRGHPSRTPPGRARRGRGAAAEQQPGRHLSETRLRRAGFGDGGRRADRCAGVAGDHRASHRNPPPHRVRHPTPHHRADAAAHARPRPDRGRPRHRPRAAPPHPDVVADRADPVVAVEDSGRDRDRAALLPGRVLRSHPAGQRGGADGAAGPLARRAPPRAADAAARLMDRR